MTITNTRDEMREVAGRRGWSLEVQLNLALDFINDLDQAEWFRPFLDDIADDEVAEEEPDEAPEAQAEPRGFVAPQTAPPTLAACRALAQREYEAHAGGVLLVELLEGYRYDENSGPESVDVRLDPPLRVRVLEQYAPPEEIDPCYGFLDPLWYVEPLEQRDALVGIESLVVCGTSFNYKTGEVEPTTTWMTAV